MQKQKEYFAKAATSYFATAPSTMNGFTPARGNVALFPDIPAGNSQPVPSTALSYNPAYPSGQNPVAATPAPKGFIHCSVTIMVEYNDEGYVFMYQSHYESLWFAVAGFGDTDAEALQDLLLAYHEVMIESLADGRPIPILRFRFVRRGRKGKKS